MAGWQFAFLCALLFGAQLGAQCEDVRVKLCGREFIRMVITSCGSVRLRRSADNPHDNQLHPDHDHRHQMYPGNFHRKPSYSNDPQGIQLQPHNRHGNQLYLAHHHGKEHHPEPNGEVPPLVDNLRSDDPAGSGSEVTVKAALGAEARLRRSAGPAGVCCRSGCTMSELVQYC